MHTMVCMSERWWGSSWGRGWRGAIDLWSASSMVWVECGRRGVEPSLRHLCVQNLLANTVIYHIKHNHRKFRVPVNVCTPLLCNMMQISIEILSHQCPKIGISLCASLRFSARVCYHFLISAFSLRISARVCYHPLVTSEHQHLRVSCYISYVIKLAVLSLYYKLYVNL